MKTRKWQMFDVMNTTGKLALAQARRHQPPVFGNWIETGATALAHRFAAATAQVGERLYVFGGLGHTPHVADDRARTDESYRHALDLLDMMSSAPARIVGDTDVPYNDLAVYDMEEASWATVVVNGMSPSPRGYARLRFDQVRASVQPASRALRSKMSSSPPTPRVSLVQSIAASAVRYLFLLGGRATYIVDPFCHIDEVWRFDLKKKVWALLSEELNPDRDSPSLNGCDRGVYILGDVIIQVGCLRVLDHVTVNLAVGIDACDVKLMSAAAAAAATCLRINGTW